MYIYIYIYLNNINAKGAKSLRSVMRLNTNADVAARKV